MKITNDLKKFFEPTKKVYGGYELPTRSREGLEWGNPDEQFTAELNLKTMELKAAYYDWDEETEDWVDGEPMSDEDLLNRIKNREFLAVS